MTPSQAASGVTYLRRRTVGRAFRAYFVWIHRAVGWTTIIYLIAWLVIFLVSGLQLIAPLKTPLFQPISQLFAIAAALFFVTPLWASRLPPVTLSRPDLYRLALAPVAPQVSLRWAFWRTGLLYIVLGLLLGLIWWGVSAAWFGQATPWAGPVLALLLLSRLNLAWLGYADGKRGSFKRQNLLLELIAILLSLSGLFMPFFGLAAAFYKESVLTLIMPLLLVMVSSWLVRRSLVQSYPPNFTAQCFVLSKLQAVRTLNAIAAFSGSSALIDASERKRLLAQLHDKVDMRTPKRSLPPPDPTQGVWRALAWRTKLMFLRRSYWQQASLLLLLLAAGIATVTTTESLLGFFLTALIVGRASVSLIGPTANAHTLPFTVQERTLGRIVPGAIIASFVSLLSLLALNVVVYPVPLSDIAAAVTLLPLVLVLLEKLSMWVNLSPQRFEAWFVVAVLSLSPALLLTALGLGLLIAPLQVLLIFALLSLPG